MESLPALCRLRQTDCLIGLRKVERPQKFRTISPAATDVVSPKRLRHGFLIEAIDRDQKLKQVMRKFNQRYSVSTLFTVKQPIAQGKETLEW